jgi:hypothetical protein
MSLGVSGCQIGYDWLWTFPLAQGQTLLESFPLVQELAQDLASNLRVVKISEMVLHIFDLVDNGLRFFS